MGDDDVWRSPRLLVERLAHGENELDGIAIGGHGAKGAIRDLVGRERPAVRCRQHDRQLPWHVLDVSVPPEVARADLVRGDRVGHEDF